jgi:putative holliday junction resolvase
MKDCVSALTSLLGVKSSEKGARAILAIDYGRRKIGLALSDALALTARPLAIVPRTNRSAAFRTLRELSRQHNVGLIIVGCPLHLSGKASDLSNEATRFASRLRKELGLPVEMFDERLTTWQANQILTSHGGSSNQNRSLDALAAAVFLQEYLDERSGRRTTLPEPEEVG